MARIGLLEDNCRIAKLCATMLNYAGHQVTIYEHPLKCLQALIPAGSTSHGNSSRAAMSGMLVTLPVEVLILDLYLPDMDGVEVLRRLQSHPHTRSLPLIFCTAATDNEVARALKVAPAACVVEKPFKIQALISAVTSALNHT